MKKELKTVLIAVVACVLSAIIGSMILKKCTKDETSQKIEELRKVDSTHRANADRLADSSGHYKKLSELDGSELEYIRKAIANDCTFIRYELDSFESATRSRIIKSRQLEDSKGIVPHIP